MAKKTIAMEQDEKGALIDLSEQSRKKAEENIEKIGKLALKDLDRSIEKGET